MVLVAVQFYKIEAFGIRSPADISKVTVGGISRIQINRFLSFGIVDAYGYFMACHSCHGVAHVIQFACPCSDVYQRILRHHTFVHAVESKQVTLRTPIGSFADAEFIAVYALAAYDAFGFVGYGVAIYVQIIILGISHVTTCDIVIFVGCFFGQGLFADDFIGFPVVNNVVSGQRDKQLCFFGPRQGYLM